VIVLDDPKNSLAVIAVVTGIFDAKGDEALAVAERTVTAEVR
jgi:hypothetical protein